MFEYLLFLLLDYIVDDYIDAIEVFRKDIENLEEKIIHIEICKTKIKINICIFFLKKKQIIKNK